MLRKKLENVSLISLGCLGVLIQVQILFGATDSYMGVRINIADMMLPFFGAFVSFSFLRKESFWPQWNLPGKDVWFFALVVVIVVGLINTYLQEGQISRWALINRGIGWGILTSYIFFTGWCVTNFSDKAILYFIKCFLLFGLGTIFIGTFWFVLTQYGVKQSGNSEYRAFSGFLGNRNAYVFLILSSVTIYTFFDCNKQYLILPRVQGKLTYLLWCVLPIALVFNGSRAGWLGGVLLVGYFLCIKWRYAVRYILPSVLVSFVIIASVYSYNSEFVFREAQGTKIVELTQGNTIHKTDHLRVVVANDALELWSKHKFWGAGIGGFLKYQEDKYGRVLDQIDNSALWILTELGIFGAVVFGIFYVMVLITLWKVGYKQKAAGDVTVILAQAMMLIMILFALFSLVHQILYARYLWCLLGIVLVLPVKENLANPSAK